MFHQQTTVTSVMKINLFFNVIAHFNFVVLCGYPRVSVRHISTLETVYLAAYYPGKAFLVRIKLHKSLGACLCFIRSRNHYLTVLVTFIPKAVSQDIIYPLSAHVSGMSLIIDSKWPGKLRHRNALCFRGNQHQKKGIAGLTVATGLGPSIAPRIVHFH